MHLIATNDVRMTPRAGEYLKGTGHIQTLHIIKNNDEHRAGPHASMLVMPLDGSNDKKPTFPATLNGNSVVTDGTYKSGV